VGYVLADDDPIVADGHRILLLKVRPQFMREGVLIDLSRNLTPSPLFTVNAQPMIRSDSLFKLGSSVSICVYLWFQHSSITPPCGVRRGRGSGKGRGRACRRRR